MRVVALTAHGLCSLQEAEALVLDWFESEGLELVHGQNGVLIGRSDATLPFAPFLAMEVRFYILGAGWLQARWTLHLSQGEALQSWAEQLLLSLRRRLDQDPVWEVDGP